MPAHIKPAQSSKKRFTNKPAPRTTVLHLCSALEPGDPARETIDLAVLTQRGGWRALIASSGGSLVTEAERAAVRHTRIPLGKQGMLVNWRNRVHLETLIQKERPALIHAHGAEAIAHAFGVCRLRRLPLMADFTQPLPDHPRAHRLLKQLGDIACLMRVPSEYMARYLCKTFQLAPERLYYVPPGIDLQWHNPGSISAERLRTLDSLWRLPERASVILMSMPLAPGGGHKQLLQALARIKRNDVFAVLVGNDRDAPGQRAEIEELIGSHGLGGKVVMPECAPDWPAACWLASVIVAPNTKPRGQNIELLAAQAIGRPVIASDCGANAEMVASGETAWVVPPNNVKALAEALNEAIGLDTAQRLELTHRTRDFVAQAFPQANWFNAMMELYETLLTPPARRAVTRAA